jgi:nucleoside-triphosphatase
MERVYLLTGRPGVGKTSLIMRALGDSGVRAGGFYTEEVRCQGGRVGFDIVTLDGRRAVLSRVGLRSHHRVGKYGVDVTSLEEVGVAALRDSVRTCDTVVIDEIGKMELCSPVFRDTVIEALESGRRVLGTVMALHHPWADAIKRRPDVKVVELTLRNRDEMLREVVGWLGTKGE